MNPYDAAAVLRPSIGQQRARENLARAERADAMLMRHIVLFKPRSVLARSNFQAYLQERCKPTPMGPLPANVDRDLRYRIRG